MIELEIDSEQLADLLRSLDELDMKHMVEPVLKAVGESVIAKVRPYPPETIANWPSNPAGHWYERGFGTKYASGIGYQTSERLGDKWIYQLIYGPGVKIINAATYAGYVHGEEQAAFHKERGWKQLLKTAVDELPEILRKIERQIDRIWRGNK